MLTVPEAATLVGRNPETVRRWIRSGRLAARKLGTQLLIEEEDLLALRDGPTSVATSPARSTEHIEGLRERSAPYGSDARRRVLVALDPVHHQRLDALASRIHLSPEIVAGSLLATALDQRDPDAATLTAILDAVPGAWERAQVGLTEIRSGKGIRLEDL